MDLMEIGTKALSQALGQNVDSGAANQALNDLLSDGQGKLDLSSLVSKMNDSGGLADIVGSWLGDGQNAAISPDSLKDLFGEGQLQDFAAKLGANTDQAAGGLAEALPQILDNASKGGSLLDSFGGAGGLLDAAKSLLK